MCAGTEVFVVGHAAWNSRHKLSATVTAGVISKLVIRHNAPVLIQVCYIKARHLQLTCSHTGHVISELVTYHVHLFSYR